MKIKWCVCDLDGTLLDSKNQLSQENILAVRELLDRGVGVFLATGRTDLFVKDYYWRLGLDTPIISWNGVLVRDKDKVFFRRTINSDIAYSLAAFCLEANQDMLIYTHDLVYYSPTSVRIDTFYEYNDRVSEQFKVPLRKINEVPDIAIDDIVKFFVWNANDDIKTTIKQVHNCTGQLSLVTSMRGALDIMAVGISKGESLAFLAQGMGCDLSMTAVIGDNYNDLSMFELAALPIAVANAEEEVKLAAKHVAPSNDESGVAHAIRSYILPLV